MAITVTPLPPVVPATAPQGATADTVLQPGTTVNAQVLQQVGDNAVRIAIAGLALDVLTEVPLTAGQSLQLGVTQTADGLRLQVVPQRAAASGSASQSAATAISLSEAASSALTLDNAVIAAPANAAAPVLTLAQATAVAAAVQTAAGQQDSSASLFANAAAAATSGTLPPVLQQAAAQLLAVRPVIDGSLSGDDVEAAFKGSGLFLEQSLAATGTPPSVAGQDVPDLKAALIVFRQTVNSWLGEQGDTVASPASAANATAANPLLATALRAAAANQGAVSLQEILAAFPKGVRDAVQNLLAAETSQLGASKEQQTASVRNADPFNSRDIPPPPFRGAAPSAQPAASPSIGEQTSAHEAARTLRNDADASIARQTLLQIASLPQQADAQAPRNGIDGPRWNFEVPFATPQGTAVAQFEISRDGRGAEGALSQKVWRARFSLNVEPAGPVHALVSLSGDRTSVRIWAERPQTAAQLRADAPQLDHALREAALEPGDIVIGDGAPPQPAKAAAGHFLDRAS